MLQNVNINIFNFSCKQDLGVINSKQRFSFFKEINFIDHAQLKDLDEIQTLVNKATDTFTMDLKGYKVLRIIAIYL
jgi:hypothetical protein